MALWPVRDALVKNNKIKNIRSLPNFLVFFASLLIYPSLCIFVAAVAPWRRQVTRVAPKLKKNKKLRRVSSPCSLEQLFKMVAFLPIFCSSSASLHALTFLCLWLSPLSPCVFDCSLLHSLTAFPILHAAPWRLEAPCLYCKVNSVPAPVFLVFGVQPSVLNYIIVLLGGCKVISLTGKGRGAVLTVVCESMWLRAKGVVGRKILRKYPYTVLVVNTRFGTKPHPQLHQHLFPKTYLEV